MRMFRALLMPMRMSFRVAAGAIVVTVIGVVVIRCELGRVADMLGGVLGRPLVLVMMARVFVRRTIGRFLLIFVRAMTRAVVMMHPLRRFVLRPVVVVLVSVVG